MQRDSHLDMLRQPGLLYLISALAATGRTSEATRHVGEHKAFLARSLERLSPYQRGVTLTHLCDFQLAQRDLGDEFEQALSQFHRLMPRPMLAPHNLRMMYVVQGYGRLAQAMAAAHEPAPTALANLGRAVEQLRQAASSATLRCHLHILEAGYAWLRGRHASANRRLERAQRVADLCDSPWACYEIQRLRALMLQQRGERKAARRYAESALRLAQSHGWQGRAHELAQTFDLRLADRESEVLSASGRSSGATSVRLKHHLDALLEVSLASATVLDPREQSQAALAEVARVLGAEYACLFRTDEATGELDLQAAWDTSAGRSQSARGGYSATAVEQVRRTRKPLLAAAAQDNRLLDGSQSTVARGIRSILVAPLLLRDQLVGVIYLDNRVAKGVFTGDDLTILKAIANNIAVAFETARVARLEVERLAQSRRIEQQQLLLEISHKANASLDLESMLHDVARLSARACAASHCLVFLLESDRRLRPVVAEGPETSLDRSIWHGIASGAGTALDDVALFAQAVEQQQPRAQGPDSRGPHSSPPWFAQLEAEHAVAVPLFSRDLANGILLLSRGPAAGGAFAAAQIDLARTIGGLVASAVENARLFGEVRALASTDALTGLHNRRHLMAESARELTRARRYGHGLALVILDVDHFKRVNDTHGHTIGDDVLVEVAQRCRSCVRDVDLTARYGGEEFVLVLPETPSIDQALIVAERLRAAVAAQPVVCKDGTVVPVTISLGVAQLQQNSERLDQLLQRADAALYRAKEGGRNRVASAELSDGTNLI